jgi:precorrin-8X/cobalt-precorrin-8 methylmutase
VCDGKGNDNNKESILLIGHGSPKQDANNLERIAEMIHNMIHRGCESDRVGVAYMEFASPGIKEAILERIRLGAKKLILHPFFLNAGVHVTKDIPEIIRELQNEYPGIEFVYTDPLGTHEKLAHIAIERINAAERLKPEEIESRSFSMIAAEADLDSIPADRQPIVKRVVHATADFDFKDNLVFHPDAVAGGLDAIKKGKDILTDVEMVRTGINKKALARWGGSVVCGLEPNIDESKDSDDSEDVAGNNTNRHLRYQTRSEKGIEKALTENPDIGIIAIGNAPTALLKAIEILNSNPAYETPGGCAKPLLVGVPVGFVKAVESKMLLSEQKFPFITALGRKGGTPVAVAIVNALLKMAESE